MSNTIIELRYSQQTGNVPTSLANGELAINTYDGKIFYRGGASNTVQTIERYQGPSGLNGEVQFNDSGTLGANSQLSFAKSTGVLSTKYLTVTNSQGDEGGEILLAKSVTNTTLSGTGVTIDVYQNKLRFFEQGGSARGAYIDLTTTGAGVGTNLLSSSAVSSVGGQTGAISNTQILSFVQAVSSTNNITFDYVAAANNGYGQNFKVGDDAWIGDYNVANSIRIKGAQDPSNAYINFGNSDTATLGRAGTGNLTYTAGFNAASLNATANVNGAAASFTGNVTVGNIAGSTSTFTYSNLGTVTSGTWNGTAISTAYISGLTTANVTELNNLYYTDTRAYSNVTTAGFYKAVSNTAPISASGSGTTLSVSHLNSGVTAASYGSAAIVPVYAVDTYGRITSASNVAISVANSSITGNIISSQIQPTGVTASTYGSAAIVPVYAVDQQGRITSASNVSIAIASGAVSGLATSATTDTTNATNISSGTLAAARLATSGVKIGRAHV